MSKLRGYRIFIASVVVLSVVALWVYQQFMGSPMNPLVDVVVIIIIFASGRTVFGGETFSKAITMVQDFRDTATEVRKAAENLKDDEE